MSLLIYKSAVYKYSNVYPMIKEIISQKNLYEGNDGMSLIIKDNTIRKEQGLDVSPIYIYKIYGSADILLNQILHKKEDFKTTDYEGYEISIYIHEQKNHSYKKATLLPPFRIPPTLVEDIYTGCQKETELPIIISNGYFKELQTPNSTGFKNLIISDLISYPDSELGTKYIQSLHKDRINEIKGTILFFPRGGRATDFFGNFVLDPKTGLKYSYVRGIGNDTTTNCYSHKAPYQAGHVGFKTETVEQSNVVYSIPIIDFSKRPKSFSAKMIDYQFANEPIKIVKEKVERKVPLIENRPTNPKNEYKEPVNKMNVNEHVSIIDSNNKNDFFIELIEDIYGHSKGDRFIVEDVYSKNIRLKQIKEETKEGKKVWVTINPTFTFKKVVLEGKYKIIVRANKMEKYNNLAKLLKELGTSLSTNKTKKYVKLVNQKINKVKFDKPVNGLIQIKLRNETSGSVYDFFNVRIDAFILYLTRYGKEEVINSSLYINTFDFDTNYAFNNENKIYIRNSNKKKVNM